MKKRKPDHEAQKVIKDMVKAYGTQYQVAKKLEVNKGLVSESYNHATYSPTLRKALGLPLLAMVPICGYCGKVHDQLKTCAEVREKRVYPPTLKIRKDNVKSAARSMLDNLDQVYLLDLLDLLIKNLFEEDLEEADKRLRLRGLEFGFDLSKIWFGDPRKENSFSGLADQIEEMQ